MLWRMQYTDTLGSRPNQSVV